MAFRTVVITQHCKINYQLNHLKVRTEDNIAQIPVNDISVLLIATTQAVITGYCIAELLKENVKVIFCDDHGIPVGEINGYFGNKLRNRCIAKQVHWDSKRTESLWQLIVQRKIENQGSLLSDLALNDTGFAELQATVAPGDSHNREAVAAKMYFPRLFGATFTRQDGANLINAHLNYGYQIFMAALAREIHSAGYLTEIGIHHVSSENEFNLASDLMEIFRPLVDRQVYEQRDKPLEREQKLALVDLLNDVVRINGHQSTVTNAMGEVTRQALDYLSGKRVELPEWVLKNEV
ncbi:CRISPR-associated protein Cas1 [Agrilactobacillus composti DSM 18527 = JCM 14202]|nr:CRISPR-associated protein Cas1 [Agrilactobacillus composti DSM 18527 = JCM 14202]